MLDFSLAELYSFLVTVYCMYLTHVCRKCKREMEKNSRAPRQR